MRLNRPVAKGIAGALAIAVAAFSPLDTWAQGDFFDYLFGPEPPSAYPARRSFRVAPPRPRPRAPKAAKRYDGPPSDHVETDSTSGGGYCVRACDGYYFPLIKSSLISGQQSCEFACPSAHVQLYQGDSIEEARNAKGERYSALPAAFSFRDRLTAGCACNDPSSSHDYFRRLSRKDPTLRAGDVVVGEKEASVYSGSGLVSLSHAPTSVRAQVRNLLPHKIAGGYGSASAVALNRTHRHSK